METTITTYNENLPDIKTREAILTAERNRFFIVSIVALCIALYCVHLAVSASKKPRELKVIYCKMYRDGSWDIEVYDEKKPVEYFKNTINHNITQFITRRYQEKYYSISGDYGFVCEIMAPKLKKEFLRDKEDGGIGAAEKAAAMKDCITCNTKEVKVRNIAHFEADKTKFGSNPGVLYKTNVFIEITEKRYTGESVGIPKKMIVPIEWRLKTKEEIVEELEQKSRKGDDLTYFYHNPIGFQVMDYKIMADGSQ